MLMSLFLYLTAMAPSYCFEKFAINGKISAPVQDGGLGGSPFNIVKPVGRVAIVCFAISYALLSLFNRWASKQVKEADVEESSANNTIVSSRDAQAAAAAPNAQKELPPLAQHVKPTTHDDRTRI